MRFSLNGITKKFGTTKKRLIPKRGAGNGGNNNNYPKSTGFGGGDNHRNWSLALAITALNVSLCGQAQAADEKNPIEKFVDTYGDVVGPMLTNLGLSGVFGFSAAFAAKLVGKALMVAVGLMFIFIQLAAYSGVITVNYTHLQDKVEGVVDINRDGKVDTADLKLAMNKGLGLLSQGVPSVGGFMAGFALGLKLT